MKTRKRIEFKNYFGHVWVHTFTCTGRKLIKLAPMALLCMALGSCNTQPKTSWEVYCEMYNVDVNNPSEYEENYYLDCWVGNDECEVAMSWNAFSEHYVLDAKAPTTREIADFVLAWRGSEDERKAMED